MFRRRKEEVKAWALDEENVPGVGGLRERLGANNKLWIAFLVLVIVFSAVLVANSVSTPMMPQIKELEEDPIGVYTDSDHRKFADSFEKMARKRGLQVEARFISDRTFKLVVPCDIAHDELTYLSKAAASGIYRQFKVSPVVWTYTEDVNKAAPRLIARTEWSSDRGDFIVRFERAMGSE